MPFPRHHINIKEQFLNMLYTEKHFYECALPILLLKIRL
jgi:hypothetical protein